MRILQVHNFYQHPGGEDQVYAAEFELLKQHGHAVEQYSAHNDAVNQMSALGVAWRTIWNSQTYRSAREVIRHFRPQIVHCHNTFPVISPAIYYAAHRERVPVVQTIHNYRLICPAATLYRDGHVCQDCIGHAVPYNGVLHGCYRGSRAASAAVASMLTVHRLARTWSTKINRYIALTAFAKNKLVEGGLPAEKIVVKPNFLAADPGQGTGSGGFALFVGRLSEEKGLRTLLRAWRQIPEIPLKIIGSGPLLEFVKLQAQSLPNVIVLGFCQRDCVLEQMRAASCLILPSEWYEGFPMTIVEAMACGTPVLASDIGSLRELITGKEARFPAGDADRLTERVKNLFSQTGKDRLRQQARHIYEANYTADRNYHLLLGIYQNVATSRD